MKIRINCIIWAFAFVCFSSLASASEDSPSPFPDDFVISEFSDLPDIDYEATVPENISVNSSTAAESTPLPITDQNQPVPPPPPSDIVNQNNADSTPEPIFIPKPANTEDKSTENKTNSPESSLTETLKQDKSPNSIIEGTWVEKLTSVNPLSVFKSEKKEDDPLKEMVKNSRVKNKDGRSNASVFDISGLMLRMSLNQVEKTMANRGFQKLNAKYTIPNFIKWRNEENCRNQGVVGYERIQSCIASAAKKEGHEYIHFIKYAKFDSKEEISVYLTSNFTENKVYKITYKSTIAAINGNSPKAIYIRNLKVYDFWKKINQKYGNPDNKTNVTWGMGGNKPFLKAATGYLLLEDPMFREMDYTRMSQEDQRFIHSDFYNF